MVYNFTIFRIKFNLLSSIILVILFSLIPPSSGIFRLKSMEQFSANNNFYMTTVMGLKILRKGMILSESPDETQVNFLNKLDNSFASFLERNMVLFYKEWSASKIFLGFSQKDLNRINSLYDEMKHYRNPDILEGLPVAKHYNLFIQSQKPYIAQTGCLENDVDPSIGRLNFDYSGEFALDYHLRSIGATLGSKKTVVKINLRSGDGKTRIRPINLSLWISNDNILYLKHNEYIVFSNDSQGITLYLPKITTQYLKVHCDFEDDNYTFVNNFKNILNIYGPPTFPKSIDSH
jgi:hypothetical protein